MKNNYVNQRVALIGRTMLLILFFLISLLSLSQVFAYQAVGTIALAELPPQAQATLRLIQQGGPFPYSKDGVVFGNYEALLPRQEWGYYHEYTVKTPRIRHRGARRIITGGDPQDSQEYYYTNDHYQTFMRILE